MSDARLRVRSVKFKNGGSVRLLPGVHVDPRRKLIEGHIRSCFETLPDPDGYALILWDKEGASASGMLAGGPIVTALVPDFAKARLTAHFISAWTRDDIG